MASTSADASMDAIALCRRRPPDIRSTHSVSTNLARLLTIDFLCRLTFEQRLLRLKKTGVRALRRALGALRDNQEILAKLAKIRSEEITRSWVFDSFRDWLQVQLPENTRSFEEKLASFDDSSLHRITRRSKVRKLLESRTARAGSIAEIRRQLLQRVRELEPQGIENKDDEALHRMRLRYKTYRYTVELLPEPLRDADSELLGNLKDLQVNLGEAHDWLVMSQLFARFAQEKLSEQRLPAWIADPLRNSHERARLMFAQALNELAAWETGQRKTKELKPRLRSSLDAWMF